MLCRLFWLLFMFILVAQVTGKSFNPLYSNAATNIMSTSKQLVTFPRPCFSAVIMKEISKDITVPFKNFKFFSRKKIRRLQKLSRFSHNKQRTVSGAHDQRGLLELNQTKYIHFKKQLVEKMNVDESVILKECLMTLRDMSKIEKAESSRYFTPDTIEYPGFHSRYTVQHTTPNLLQNHSESEMVHTTFFYLHVVVYVCDSLRENSLDGFVHFLKLLLKYFSMFNEYIQRRKRRC